jgi:hypothetical protein
MDRNNPVWREYLKAVIRIQIDAGVDGVQLDEAELPITSMQYGGCFCKDCMKGFRAYLQAHPERLPESISVDQLGDFHYGSWLLDRGYDFKDDQSEAPLFLEYLRFQRGQITTYFAELAEYARSYAHDQGREVQVAGNFFNVQDVYLPLEPQVDVVITEMRNTTYRQPEWFRYAAGFGGSKPVVVVENPYGGVVPDLVRDLKVGRGYDLFRMSLFEAAALGVNMTIPYGAWMGSVIEDSFWPPHELCAEVQQWLVGHEHLFSRESAAGTAVVYSSESNFELETRDRALANNTLNLTSDDEIPFWTACGVLARGLQPYDVIFFHDDELRADEVTPEDLSRYSTLVLPHCHLLTENQGKALMDYLDDGGRVARIGPLGENLGAELRGSIESHERSFDVGEATTVARIVERPQVRVDTLLDAAVHLQRTEDGIAVHLIRYEYDRSEDAIPPLEELSLDVELDEQFELDGVFGAPKPAVGRLEREGLVHRLVLRDVPLYSIIALRRDREAGAEGGRS